MKSTAVIACALILIACGGRTAPRSTAADPTLVDIEQLWIEPSDLESRDLFHGVGGPDLAPPSGRVFELVKTDTTGHSPGYDVKDSSGTRWSVKLGSESQSEVAASRLLWAIGFHQPPVYFLPSWTLSGGPVANPGPGRFRPELHTHKVASDWSWFENPFVQTQAFKGLVVANLMLNSWDWKTSNNKIYEIVAGEAGASRRVYVVRDLGASLGKTSYPKLLTWMPMRGFGQGSRNHLEDFEEQGFIKRVEGHRPEFHYRGIYRSLLDTLTVGDVVWTARLLARLSDQQWHDAFRAAGYSDEHARRFAEKLKAKVAEGLALN